MGQTGRCLNDRLREHKNNVKKGGDGLLTAHCSTCGCSPAFHECSVVRTHKDETTRLIVESATIHELGQDCVSAPSLSLSRKELSFLDPSHLRMPDVRNFHVFMQ